MSPRLQTAGPGRDRSIQVEPTRTSRPGVPSWASKVKQPVVGVLATPQRLCSVGRDGMRRVAEDAEQHGGIVGQMARELIGLWSPGRAPSQRGPWTRRAHRFHPVEHFSARVRARRRATRWGRAGAGDRVGTCARSSNLSFRSGTPGGQLVPSGNQPRMQCHRSAGGDGAAWSTGRSNTPEQRSINRWRRGCTPWPPAQETCRAAGLVDFTRRIGGARWMIGMSTGAAYVGAGPAPLRRVPHVGTPSMGRLFAALRHSVGHELHTAGF